MYPLVRAPVVESKFWRETASAFVAPLPPVGYDLRTVLIVIVSPTSTRPATLIVAAVVESVRTFGKPA